MWLVKMSFLFSSRKKALKNKWFSIEMIHFLENWSLAKKKIF